jgi:hypothetical protein
MTTITDDLARGERARFLVTSLGRAATYWLAHVLGRHGGVDAIHGRVFPSATLLAHEHADVFVNPGTRSEPIGSIYGIRAMDDLDLIAASATWCDRLSLAAYFDAFEAITAGPVCGNVHGFAVSELVRRREEIAGLGVRCVNLTRHPVSRVESFHRRYLLDMERSDAFRASMEAERVRCADLIAAVETRFGVDMSCTTRWAFVAGLHRNAPNYAEACEDSVPHVRSERLTRDPELFRRVFVFLTAGLVVPDEAVVTAAFTGERLNRSREDDVAPAVQYARWEAWQRWVFHALVAPEWLAAYGRLGYEVGFLDRMAHATAPDPNAEHVVVA